MKNKALIPMAINLKRGVRVDFRLNAKLKRAIRVEAELLNVSMADYLNMLCLGDLYHKHKLDKALGEETMKQFAYAFQMQEVGEEV